MGTRSTVWLTLTVLGASMMIGAAMLNDDVPADTINTAELWRIPLGLPDEIPEPVDNAFDRSIVLLGRKLFFDPILSFDHDRACATCHQPEHGFASPETRPAALGGGLLERNAPTLFNRAFGDTQMWDGRFATLEQQALTPIVHEQEMGMTLEAALQRLGRSDEYPRLFQQAFGEGPNEQTLAKAISAFVRRLTYGDTAFDYFRNGRPNVMTSDEMGGMWIFQSRGQCWRCHNGFNLTDEQFHNTGVGVIDGLPRPGREQHTGDIADTGAFKTPTLRGLLHTPPYFHDGSAATLREVVEFYNDGAGDNPYLDENIVPLNLTEQDIDMLVAFLGAMSRQIETEPKPAPRDDADTADVDSP